MTVFLCAVLSFALPPAPQEEETKTENDPTVESIIEDHIDAIGGEMKLASIETVVIQAKLEGKNGRGSGHVAFLSKDEKWLHIFSVPELNLAKRGFDSEEVWESYGQDIVEIEPERQVNFRETVPTISRPSTWLDYDGEIELIGTETVGERECYQLEFRPEGGTPVTRYFDMESKMLIKMSYEYDETTTGDQYFSDFRKVDGFTVPFVREQHYDRGGATITHEYTMRKTSVEFDRKLSKDIFEKGPVTEEDRDLVDTSQ